MFQELDEILNNNDHQKPSFDNAQSPSKPDEITISQAQVIHKEMNEGKFPEQLRFFTGGNIGINKLKIHATNKLKSQLNKSNKAFLDHLTSDYVREILAKYKMKIHLELETFTATRETWKHL